MISFAALSGSFFADSEGTMYALGTYVFENVKVSKDVTKKDTQKGKKGEPKNQPQYAAPYPPPQ